MRKIVIACDKFKGSLSAQSAAEALSVGLRETAPATQALIFPAADGGEGTLDAFITAGYNEVQTTAAGPVGEPVATRYAVQGKTAVVELAEICGIPKLPNGKFAPLTSSTYGLGEVVHEVLDRGFEKIVLAVGGSASTDGGAGLASALGARINDANGRSVPPNGGGLIKASSLDISNLHPQINEAHFLLASDVRNPLLGSSGAVATYARQKGADKEDRELLERGLATWAALVEDCCGLPGLRFRHGAGAAGGVGFGAMALLDAQVKSGVSLVLEALKFPQYLRDADLVITGEGALDHQTLEGKAVQGVAAAAMDANVPVVAVCGANLLPSSQLPRLGVNRVIALTDIEPDIEACKDNAYELLTTVGRRIGRHLAN